MLKYIIISIVFFAINACESNHNHAVSSSKPIRKILTYDDDEDIMYIERITIIKDVIAFEYQDTLNKGFIVELWLKGRTHTNKLFLTKFDFEKLSSKNRYLDIIKYEQFLLDSVSTRELGMLTQALKTSKEMVRERKSEYLKINKVEKNKYFVNEVIDYISTCNKESMDYLLGIDILLYNNKDYPEYNRKCIRKPFEICDSQNELEEW